MKSKKTDEKSYIIMENIVITHLWHIGSNTDCLDNLKKVFLRQK